MSHFLRNPLTNAQKMSSEKIVLASDKEQRFGPFH
jgi:hypothetical protein